MEQAMRRKVCHSMDKTMSMPLASTTLKPDGMTNTVSDMSLETVTEYSNNTL